jgi:1-deoxy-D-xylulose-5-phosphate reductoisomerase
LKTDAMSLLNLTILGCTGSIGTNTLDVVARHPERYQVFALCAHRQIDLLFQQCVQFRPKLAVVADADLASDLSKRLQEASLSITVMYGPDALCAAASDASVDVVMASIVGAAGLAPTMAAVRTGKRVLLANKESLVTAGAVFMAAVAESGATLLPVDSEHNAIFQSLPMGFKPGLVDSGVRRILLTASGGPFRGASLADLEKVTPEAACAHPNWVMGKKISVDSASLMNKGLEVIEARWLFGVLPEQIDVVVHPQSVIHSMVEYLDGSILAQLGNPDMRTPIAHVLAWPDRIESGVSSLDLFKVAHLDFTAPDTQRFPCLQLAYDALAAGGNAPAMLNAANEVAVDAFLNGHLSFLGIPRLIRYVLDKLPTSALNSLDDVFVADALARRQALHGLSAGVVSS